MILGNNPKLNLVGNDVLIIFGENLQISSEDIERRETSNVSQGLCLRQNFANNDG